MTLGILAPAFLALLALAAVIIWLHSTQAVRTIVPSLHIWLTLPDVAGVSQRRRRLPKPSVLLLVQLAALVALVLALTQPFFGQRPADHLVVVLDGSGEMGVSAEGGLAFQTGKASVSSLLTERNGAPPKRVSLILAGPQPQLIAARHGYEPKMADALLAGRAFADGPIDWHRVETLVAQSLVAGEGTEAVFVGATQSLAPLTEMEGIGTVTSREIALPTLAPRLDVRLDQTEDGKWRLHGTVSGPSEGEAVVVSVGFTSPVDIGSRPPLNWTSFKLKLVEGKAQLDEKLAFKDLGLVSVTATREGTTPWAGATANFLTTPAPRQRVLYLADDAAEDQPFARALLALDGLDLYRANALPADVSGFGLVIVDDITIDAVPEADTVWIGNAGIGAHEAAPQRINDADDIHPLHELSQNLDWHTPNFGMVSTRPLPEHALTLVSGSGQPLFAVGQRESYRDLYLRFDPRRVNFRGSDLLPLLAHAITDWTGMTGAARGNCTVGLSCAADAGRYESGTNTLEVSGKNFVPTTAGVFISDAGDVIVVNPAHPRFALGEEDTAHPEAAQPLALMRSLIVLALVLLAIDAGLRYRKSGKRALTALVAIAMLGAALAGLSFPLPYAQSVQIALVPHGDVAKGETITVAAGPQPRLAAASEAPPKLPSRITHVEEALGLAAAMVPPYQSAEVAALAPLRLGVDAQGRLDVPARLALRLADALPQTASSPEVIALALPADGKAGDRLVLTALVRSEIELPAQIGFHANGTQLAVEGITLQAGMNRIETELPPLALGETLFTVALSTQAGPASKLSAVTRAHAGRPILVLAPDASHGLAFAEMTGADDVRVISPAAAPDYLREWLDYDAVVLLNMPARAVTSREAGIIETAVSQHGLGLLALGGHNAFGPGGYYATPFEKLSPLSARVPRDAPEVTMVFVLDRSGSMNQTVGAGTRLELARQATAGAIELLNPASQVGIVVFDNEARTVLPLTAASDMDAVRAALAKIDTGGGTAIAPGLQTGWELLRGSAAQARHMIVMSDGLSQPGDFGGIAGQMRDEGITVSAVAVGTEADTKAVTAIATAGGGSVHASSDFASLPSILSQEAMLLSSPVREGIEQVRRTSSIDPLLGALPNELPAISGLVLTTEKPEARVALTSANADGEAAPLLATWRYGNGHVLAYTSDVTGDWTRGWQGMETLNPFWPHVLRQIRPSRPANGPWLTLTNGGESLKLTLEALDDEGAPRSALAPLAEVKLGDGTILTLPMAETDLGTYTASFATDVTGRIHASVTVPSPERQGSASQRGPAEQTAEAAYYLNRPYWAQTLAEPTIEVKGGLASTPSGWAVRLVPGLTAPWLVLALLTFLIALFFYMRPPRATQRRAPTQASNSQGMAS